MLNDIFAGLEKFGMRSVLEKNTDIYHQAATDNKPLKETLAKRFSIDDYIYAKNFVCAVCDQSFKSYVVKHGKTRVESVEFDLRPIHTPIEPMLYDVVMCTSCGFTSLNAVFNKITRREAEKVLEEITPHFKPEPPSKEPTIDMAIDRYKLALLNAVVRNAKECEKAYICMRITWLYRIKGEALGDEKKFAALALQGYTSSLEKESTNLLKLEEGTILYLMGSFSYFLGDNAASLKILASIIASNKSSHRLKERARDLRDRIIEEMRKGNDK